MKWPRRRTRRDGAWEAPMSVALGLGLGFFVLTAVGSVLAVGLVSGFQNTFSLLKQKAELLVTSEVNKTLQYFEAARNQVDFIAAQIDSGAVEAGPSDEFTNLLLGSLAATPQIVRIQYVAANRRLVAAERQDLEVRPLFQSLGDDKALRSPVDTAETGGESFWGPLLWRQEYQQATLNYHHPVFRDGAFVGVVSALISVRILSEVISDLETEFGANAFILLGRDQVLAHPLMAFGYEGLTRLSPLPKQAVFGDPVLASMWQERSSPLLEERVLSGPGISFVQLGELTYVFLHREITGYADKPLIIGTYLQSADLLSEVLRLKWAIVLCLIISVLSSLTAAYIGRQISRPVRRLSEGSMKVHDLDLASVERIPGSFFRELNDAAHSFNTMLDGLRWFERYVPKSLVTRLIRLHRREGITSQFREVAIMFTDIVGFTTMSENMDAPVAAEILNEHFTMVAGNVEAEDGIIDKYIGDAVMAVWGAPEVYDDPADRACRTALAIERGVRDFNARRAAAGEPTIRLRIGIHLGRVVVGNIGSPGRINYTVIGDAVNVARRMEECCTHLGRADGDINILMSGAVHAALTESFHTRDLGTHKLRGRHEAVDIHALGESEAILSVVETSAPTETETIKRPAE